ncbi:MAG: zinc ribbon domain-containing protein [Planctomycetes bacterium]|nr:zinc ribbon domain-containing protein [Planctomycetota bacterium]
MKSLPRLCSHCDHVNPSTARFCESCGFGLDRDFSTSDDSRSDADGASAKPEDRAAKAHARREFARIKQVVFRLRSLYWVIAALDVVYLLLILTILKRTAELVGEEAVEGADFAWILIAILGGLAVIHAIGAIFVTRAPVVWAIVLASLQTLWLGILVVSGDGSIVEYFVQGLLTVILWAAVGQASRAQQLLEENPEFELQRQRMDRDRHVDGGVADNVRSRRKRGAERKRHSALLVGALSVAVLGIGVLGVWWATRPPSADTIVEAFTERWNDGKPVGELAAYFVRGPESGPGLGMTEAFTRRGWESSRPNVSEVDREESDHSVLVTYRLGDGGAADADAQRVRASFAALGDRWILTGVDLPELEVGPLDPAVRDFEAAWNGNGPDAIFAMMEAGFRDAKQETFRRVMQKREWFEKRPRIADATVSLQRNGRARAAWELEGDELSVKLEWWKSEWKVVGLRLPSR